MKKLERKWRVIIGWTLFCYTVLLVILVRYQLTREIQKPLRDVVMTPQPAGSPSARSRSQDVDPRKPDDSARQVSDAEMASLMSEALKEWQQVEPERREAALISRLADFRAIHPEALDGVVQHLMRVSQVERVEPKSSELSDLDLDSAVTINMRSGVNSQGEEGVWVDMQDREGRVGSLWIPADEVSPEERQALRAFTLMEQVPGLDKVRPLLTPLLRRSLNP